LNRLLLLSLAYFTTGWLGLQIPYAGTHITLIWLPTGVAVAALLRWKRSVWPGIFIGSCLVNLSIGSPWLLALGISVPGSDTERRVLKQSRISCHFRTQKRYWFFHIVSWAGNDRFGIGRGF